MRTGSTARTTWKTPFAAIRRSARTAPGNFRTRTCSGASGERTGTRCMPRCQPHCASWRARRRSGERPIRWGKRGSPKRRRGGFTMRCSSTTSNSTGTRKRGTPGSPALTLNRIAMPNRTPCADPPHDLRETRASLLVRMRDWQDRASWQQFFDTYWKLIYGVARRSDLTDAEAQDVVQEVMASVAKHIPTFRYDPAKGSFKTWLMVMTRWRIISHLRKRGPLDSAQALADD